MNKEENMTFPQIKKRKLFEQIDAGTCSLKTISKLQEELDRRACFSKLKLDYETAASRLWRYPDPNTSLYVCPVCSWLHVGHQQNWAKEAVRIVTAKVAAKKRNPTTKTPKWQKDPRRSND
jgi:hypothetical protein